MWCCDGRPTILQNNFKKLSPGTRFFYYNLAYEMFYLSSSGYFYAEKVTFRNCLRLQKRFTAITLKVRFTENAIEKKIVKELLNS